jgi:hypothetical protein
VVLSAVGMAGIHGATAFATPPARLPDLFTVALVAFSFVHFFLFWLYLLWRQAQLPAAVEQKKKKVE